MKAPISKLAEKLLNNPLRATRIVDAIVSHQEEILIEDRKYKLELIQGIHKLDRGLGGSI